MTRHPRSRRTPARQTPVAALAAAALLAGCSGGASTGESALGVVTTVPPAERVAGPELAGPTLDGGELATADLEGDVVVVNAWGSWCGPCRAEAEDLEQVRAATEDDGVEFVGLTVKDEPDAARAFVRQRGVTYPSVSPGEPLLLGFRDSLPATSTPTTWVLDREGRVAARVLGAVSATTLQGLVDDVLAEGGG